MKHTTLLLTVALLAGGLAIAQSDRERRRFNEIQGRIRNNQAVSKEDRDFAQQIRKRQNEEFAREHPPRDSTGMIPLPDLGKGTYKGEQGGLYPGGANVPPAAHLKAGVKIAKSVRPLDPEGRPSNDGK